MPISRPAFLRTVPTARIQVHVEIAAYRLSYHGRYRTLHTPRLSQSLPNLSTMLYTTVARCGVQIPYHTRHRASTRCGPVVSWPGRLSGLNPTSKKLAFLDVQNLGYRSESKKTGFDPMPKIDRYSRADSESAQPWHAHIIRAGTYVDVRHALALALVTNSYRF